MAGVSILELRILGEVLRKKWEGLLGLYPEHPRGRAPGLFVSAD
jgi:hypothetical protein